MQKYYIQYPCMNVVIISYFYLVNFFAKNVFCAKSKNITIPPIIMVESGIILVHIQNFIGSTADLNRV